jgi:hypothetical protein
MVPASESLDMNILAVPALVSLVATGFLVLGVGAGMVLQLSRRLAPAGKSLLWYSSTSLFLAIIFAWMGLFTLAPVLGLAVGERGFFFGLWASGPVGLLVGLVWARRNSGGQHILRGKPVSWWMVGGMAFVLLGLGLWLTWGIAMDSEPPNRRIGFWLWLERLVSWVFGGR